MGYLLLIVMIFIADFGIKKIVEKKLRVGDVKSCFQGRIFLQRYHNRGFALNAFEKYPKLVAGGPAVLWAVMFLSLVVLLFKKGYTGVKLALSMINGGALSNLYDRLTKHYVVDYIRFGVKWKWLRKIVFNVSDLFIIVGTVLLVASARAGGED